MVAKKKRNRSTNIERWKIMGIKGREERLNSENQEKKGAMQREIPREFI